MKQQNKPCSNTVLVDLPVCKFSSKATGNSYKNVITIYSSIIKKVGGEFHDNLAYISLPVNGCLRFWLIVSILTVKEKKPFVSPF